VSAVVKPKVKVWVVFSDDMKFGEGRARLLEVIGERGSLQQAAKQLEMSYRSAWGYLRELERAAGFKFVHRMPGGGARGGMRLTPEGRRFVADYRRFNASLARATERCFARAFPPSSVRDGRTERRARAARRAARPRARFRITEGAHP
jgi:molybdate transport system regulatory protein